MKLSSPSRIIAVALAIVSMLFMQLALAAYVCPAMPPAMQEGAEMAMAMPGCAGMDIEQPVLCHAHAQDQASKQSLDKPDLPLVTPFIATQLVQTLRPAPQSVTAARPVIAAQSGLHATAPPIAIRHCCFRL